MRTSIGIGPAAAFGAALVSLLAFSQTAEAYGEESNGFPNWAERVIHEWTNRAHADPQAELQSCSASDCGEKTCYSPIAPVAWSEAINHSARYHSDEMLAQNFFDHPSKCDLVGNLKDIYPSTCKGDVSCACQNAQQTCSGSCPSAGQRMTLFGASGGAENIAWYSKGAGDPVKIFNMWLFETSGSSTCAFGGANGHRWNLLKNTGSVGVGVVDADKYMATMDFSGNGAPPKIPSGSHFPRQGTSVDVWANWYDGAAPRSSAVNVDGTCTAMKKERGSDANGAYHVALTNVASGCHRYFFRFTDSSGAIVDYPSTGTLGIGPAASCADWQAGAHAACGTTPPPGGGGGGSDAGGGGGGFDAGGGGTDPGGGGTDPGGGLNPGGGVNPGGTDADAGGSSNAGQDGTDVGGGGGGCATSGLSASSWPIIGVLAAFLGAGVRRRRQRAVAGRR